MWDLLFLEGEQVLLRVAAAAFQLSELALMRTLELYDVSGVLHGASARPPPRYMLAAARAPRLRRAVSQALAALPPVDC